MIWPLPSACSSISRRGSYRSFYFTSMMALVVAGNIAAQTQTPTPSLSAGNSPAPAATVTSSPALAKEDLLTVLKAAGNFKTLLKAVEAADLGSTLQKPGPYTIFAPTDTAFTKLPAGRLDELLKPENKAKLVKLLSYHLSPGKLTTADLSKADEAKTLEGTELDIELSADGKTVEVDDAKLLGTDLEASNGVVHAIDAVLQP